MGLFNFKKNKYNIKTSLIEHKDDVNLEFSTNKDALAQIFNAYSFYGEEKHIFNRKIIDNFHDSNNPNDVLAVAIAYLGEGYSSRKDAINYFEKYLSKPTNQKYFQNWFIYSNLANLYESEYDFIQAIYYLDKLIEIDVDSNIANYTRKGNVLVKQDVNTAIDYYNNLKTKDIYKKYKETIDKALSDVVQKKQKGYVYKPRKHN